MAETFKRRANEIIRNTRVSNIVARVHRCSWSASDISEIAGWPRTSGSLHAKRQPPPASQTRSH